MYSANLVLEILEVPDDLHKSYGYQQNRLAETYPEMQKKLNFLKQGRYFVQKTDFWRLQIRYMYVMGINRTDYMRRNRGRTFLLKFLKHRRYFADGYSCQLNRMANVLLFCKAQYCMQKEIQEASVAYHEKGQTCCVGRIHALYATFFQSHHLTLVSKHLQ